MSYAGWLQRLPIPWLVGDHGKDWWGAVGAVFDGEIERARAAVKCRLPGSAPSDALGFVASERGLERGPAETDDEFALRLQYAWDLKALTGTPLGLLLALYYAGFPGAVVVQQNGRGYELTGTPSLADITAPLYAAPSWFTVTELSANPAIEGAPPWWSFDLDVAFCSRFAVLFPGPVYPSSFRTFARATFTASETATVIWPNAFDDASYRVLVGPATVTDASGPVTVAADGSSFTDLTARVTASAPFSGYVDCIAYQAGANPFADPHPVDLARLWRVIDEWRGAKMTCVDVAVVPQGACWGWPVTTWGARSSFGPETTVLLERR